MRCTLSSTRMQCTLSNTCMLCSVAKTAAERVTGTMVGGLAGLLVRIVGEQVAPTWEWLVYGLAAGAVGFAGTWVGDMLAQGQSAKLFVLTFLLVFAGSDSVVCSPVLPSAPSLAPLSPSSRLSPPSPLSFSLPSWTLPLPTLSRPLLSPLSPLTVTLTLFFAVTVMPASGLYCTHAHVQMRS